MSGQRPSRWWLTSCRDKRRKGSSAAQHPTSTTWWRRRWTSPLHTTNARYKTTTSTHRQTNTQTHPHAYTLSFQLVFVYFCSVLYFLPFNAGCFKNGPLSLRFVSTWNSLWTIKDLNCFFHISLFRQVKAVMQNNFCTCVFYKHVCKVTQMFLYQRQRLLSGKLCTGKSGEALTWWWHLTKYHWVTKASFPLNGTVWAALGETSRSARCSRAAPYAVTVERKLTDETMICAEIKRRLWCFHSCLKHETKTKGCFAAFSPWFFVISLLLEEKRSFSPP